MLCFCSFNFSLHFNWNWKKHCGKGRNSQRKQKTLNKFFSPYYIHILIFKFFVSLERTKLMNNPLREFLMWTLKEAETFKMLNICLILFFYFFYIFISGNSRSYQQWMYTVKVQIYCWLSNWFLEKNKNK